MHVFQFRIRVYYIVGDLNPTLFEIVVSGPQHLKHQVWPLHAYQEMKLGWQCENYGIFTNFQQNLYNNNLVKKHCIKWPFRDFASFLTFADTACASDIRLYLTPLGQARQYIETCGTWNLPYGRKFVYFWASFDRTI